ncbi:hypothetical protein C8Q70DRAFT_1058548 [Cubamyces menziesii]|nr:hypothetical protein C8Q70DRAFT_1058548 [Cubamyces menziesii]
MRFSGFSLASLPALALALCLLLASSPAEALSIPPSLKAPPRVKSVRATDGWTNAKRLAAGLPPRAPRTFKRATPTVPDPYAPVKRSAPSPSPSPFAFARPAVETAYEGRIVARYAGSDVPVGYVRASSSGVSVAGDVSGEDEVQDGARVAFKTTGSKALFSITALQDTSATIDSSNSGSETSQESESTTLIGAAGASTLSSGSASAVPLGTVKQTAPHARPALTGGESAIWTFDAATKALTAHWVNPDGSHPHTRVAYRARDGALFVAGDVAAYNAAHPGDVVSEVTLYLESD